MIVKLLPNDKGCPVGKLADAELHFTDGVLTGLRLLGFAIWEARSRQGRRNVTFPSRAYSVNGERRSFSLLRPTGADVQCSAQNAVRDLILQAWDDFERQCAEVDAAAVAQTTQGDRTAL